MLLLWFLIAFLNNVLNILCFQKSLHFDTSIIMDIPFDIWNLKGCCFVASHGYGRIDFSHNLTSYATLLEKEKIMLSFLKGIKDEIIFGRMTTSISWDDIFLFFFTRFYLLFTILVANDKLSRFYRFQWRIIDTS